MKKIVIFVNNGDEDMIDQGAYQSAQFVCLFHHTILVCTK